MSIGGFILVMVLIFVAYCLGFANGISYLLHKIHNIFEYNDYRNIMNKLYSEQSKEE